MGEDLRVMSLQGLLSKRAEQLCTVLLSHGDRAGRARGVLGNLKRFLTGPEAVDLLPAERALAGLERLHGDELLGTRH